MRLKRWRSILLILMITLAACGTADTPDLAISDTGVEPSTTPDGASPIPATNVPTERATSEPTEIATSEVTTEPTHTLQSKNIEQTTPTFPNINISLTDIITIEQHTASTALYSWSPDGSMVLFSNLGAEHDRISIFNINTREVVTVEREGSTRLEINGGIVLDYIEPVWTPECCTLILPKRGPSEATQQLGLYQSDGTLIEDLGIFPRGPFYLDPQGKIVVLHEQGLKREESSDSQVLSGVYDVYARLRMTPVDNGQFFYPEHKNILHLYDPVNKKDRFTLNLVDLPTLGKPLSKDAEFGPHALLSNQQEIIFWVKDGASASFWVTDFENNNPRKITSMQASPFHMSLSPDSTKLVWTESVHRSGKAISVLDIRTGQSINVGGGFDTAALWHPTKPMFITSRIEGESLNNLQRVFYIYQIQP